MNLLLVGVGILLGANLGIVFMAMVQAGARSTPASRKP